MMKLTITENDSGPIIAQFRIHNGLLLYFKRVYKHSFLIAFYLLFYFTYFIPQPLILGNDHNELYRT